MSNQWGADVQSLEELGKKMSEEGQKVADAVQMINGLLQSTWWQGPDRTAFDGEWASHQAALQQASQALIDAGGKATQNAAQQAEASGA